MKYVMAVVTCEIRSWYENRIVAVSEKISEGPVDFSTNSRRTSPTHCHEFSVTELNLNSSQGQRSRSNITNQVK